MDTMNGKSIRRTAVAVLGFTLWCAVARTVEPVVPDGSPPLFTYSLSKSSIASGEPITLDISWGDRESEINYSVTCTFMSRYSSCATSLELLDSSMKPAGVRRHVVVMPSSQAICIFPRKESISGGVVRIPVHLFVSTDVPEGAYYVRLSALEIGVVDKKSNQRTWPVLRSAPLPLEVHKSGPGEVAAIYAALLKKGLAERKEHYRGWICDDWRDYPTALHMVLWASGPSAVKTQIDALYDNDTHRFCFWTRFTVHAYQNILEYGTIEDIRRLAAIADSPEFLQGTDSNGYDSNLVWLFQELKKKGNPELLTLIEPTLCKFPDNVNILSLESPM